MTMRRGYVRLAAIGLILFGLGILVVAAWRYFAPADGPGLIVDEPEREISGCSVGQMRAVRFPIHNRANHAVQIVGLAPC